MKNLRDFILKLDSAFKMYNGRCDMENEENIFVFGYFFLLNTSHCVEAIEQHIRAIQKGVNKEPLGFDLQLEKCKKRLLNCRLILSDLKMFGDRSMDRYGYKYNDKPIANAKEMGLLIETNVNKIKDLLELLFYKVVLQGDDHFFEQYYLMFRNKLNTTNLKSEFEVCKMQFFGEDIERANQENERIGSRGPQNMLELLPNEFTVDDAKRVRRQQGKDNNGNRCMRMIRTWLNRGYVIQNTVLLRAIDIKLNIKH